MQTTRPTRPQRAPRDPHGPRRRLVALLALLLAGLVAAQSSDLFDAATRGDRDAVLAALTAGADIDARDAYGQTPLMYAISHGQPVAFVDLLVDRGADVNARTEAGWTPLMYAARDLDGQHFVDVVLLLYAAGADPTATNAEGRTARFYRRAESAAAPVEPPSSTGPPEETAGPEAGGAASEAEAPADVEAPAQADAPAEAEATAETEAPADPETPAPAGAPVGTFDAIAGHLAREAGFTAACGSRDAFYDEQWCAYRATPMPFDAFLRHWDAALRDASPAGAREPRRAWTDHRGVHVAFYDVPEGSLGVSYDPEAGLVLLTLR